MIISSTLYALLSVTLASSGLNNPVTAQDTSIIEEAATSKDRLSFSVGLEGVSSNIAIQSVAIMPGETLHLKTDATLFVPKGEPVTVSDGWNWAVPSKSGHYEVRLEKNDETMLLNVFVMTPFENGKDTSLNGYRVGQYSSKPLRGLAKYEPPRGFIDMRPSMKDIQVSPHFKLGQFICKQQPEHDPTYLLLHPDQLLKLETLLEAANDKGWEADTFFIMSGFRTPFYNAAIGNTTTSSRHLFGDASDIYIDHDHDGMMDDLNGDGKITKADAEALAELAKSIASTDKTNWPAGGIGIYGSTAAHGPFVHIDARGYPARWG